MAAISFLFLFLGMPYTSAFRLAAVSTKFMCRLFGRVEDEWVQAFLGSRPEGIPSGCHLQVTSTSDNRVSSKHDPMVMGKLHNVQVAKSITKRSAIVQLSYSGIIKYFYTAASAFYDMRIQWKNKINYVWYV
jgi:hypothetical protein